MAALHRPPPLPGDVVGVYQLGELLGVGGMATVYRATRVPGLVPSEEELDNTDSGEPEADVVALKVLHPGRASTEDVQRFRREFMTLCRLHHPGVVRVYRAGLHGDYPWIALECVEGPDLGTALQAWVGEGPALRFARAEAVLRGLCQALAYVHDQGLIHRDLKPSNVLLTPDGAPKLTDFGVVKAAGTFHTQLTSAGMLVGTVAFMAPEQIQSVPVDSRADLYALGALLYLMLTGRRPVEADSLAGYLNWHLRGVVTPPTEVDPRVPARLERIAMKLLSRDPAQRYASARQVLVALEGEGPGRPPAHGIEPALARLDARLAELRAGLGGVVVFSGALGAGKSTLMAEAVDRARGQGQDVASAGGLGDEPLQELLSQIPVRTSGEEGHAPEARLAARTVGRPWALFVDDFDQLGAADAAALTRLVRDRVAVQGEPLLLVAAIERAQGAAAELCSGASTGLSPEVHALGPLERDAVTAMVRDRGLGGTAAAALGARLADDLDGHPGAVLEQFAALEQAGWLVRGPDGALRASRSLDDLRLAPLPLPDRLRAIEARRLDRFLGATRTALDALSVIGVDTSVELLAEVAGLDAGALQAALTDLEGACLVRQWVEGVSEMVGFHPEEGPAARELAYGLVDAQARSALHRRAAAALQRRGRRRVEGLADEVALHLLRGGVVEEAYPMLLAVAQRRLKGQRVAEAEAALRQALDVRAAAEARQVEEERNRCRRLLHALEGELHERRGDLVGAERAWEAALLAAEAEGNQAASARARAGIGLVRASRGDAEGAAPGLQAAVDALPRGDLLWARAAQALAIARLHQGQLDAAALLWEELGQMGRDTGQAPVQADAELGRAMVLLAQGALGPGRAALEDAVFHLRAQAGDAGLPLGLVLLTELALADGRLAEAQDHAAAAARFAVDGPGGAWAIRALALQARIARGQGADLDAAGVAADCLALVRSRVVAQPPAVLAGVARALVDVGEAREALGLLGLAAPDAADPAPDRPQVQVLALRARALAASDPALALRLVEAALAGPLPLFPWVRVRVELDLADALERLGHPAAADLVVRAARRAEGLPLALQRLEAQVRAVRLGLGARWVEGAERSRAALAASLPDPAAFVARWTP
jgi:tetratricopeptide (TPR) repeat protein